MPKADPPLAENTEFETNLNFLNSNVLNVLNFKNFEFEFVLDFEFRASCF